MKVSRTIVYTHGGGRLGNQIIRYAHWMAWARAQAEPVEVVNIAFWPFANFFSEWRQHPGCMFPGRSKRVDEWARRCADLPGWCRLWPEHGDRLARAVHAMGRWRPGWKDIALDDSIGESIDLDGAAFSQRIAGANVIACSGWKISCWQLFQQQQAELRSLFRPAPDWSLRPTAFVAALRQRHDFLIGVFVRQSDYRVWDDGRFYFSSAQYAVWIRQLLDLHPGRMVAVIIASEERQDPSVFAGLPCYFATGSVNSGGPAVESWIELSMCDLIVSPPSTFSATAAFLGAVPIWPLVETGQAMAFDQIIPDNLVGAARHQSFSRSVK